MLITIKRLWPLVFLVLTLGVAAGEITRSENDDRQYKYLRLDNGLKVLLISDPATDKAAAAVDVWIGAGEDPVERPGLAHFLEHMLFLGTEKYPEADAYQGFISGHGGSQNAYTSLEHTNYFFDIDPGQLEPALDRFAQFFVAPLFDADYVDRERKAVESEYRARIQNEGRRVRDVFSELVVPDSPLSKFTTGNIDTLWNDEDNSLRAAVVAFYRDYYSADRMALAVLGRESTDQMEKWVKETFSSVPKREVTLEPQPQLFADDFLPAAVNVKPLSEVRDLSFIFPIPSTTSHYAEKPVTFISHLLGHEADGSLLSVLKEAGWAEGLSAGEGQSWRGGSTFNVSIALTREGQQHVGAIQQLLFKELELIRRRGVKQWRYEELQRLGEIAFRFQEKRDPINQVSHYAQTLHQVTPSDILVSGYLYREFDGALIRDYLDYLRPRNMLRIFTAPDVQTDSISAYYATPYAISELRPAPQMDKRGRKLARELALPEPNPYIPDNLSLVYEPEKATDSPRAPALVADAPAMKAWYLQDRYFGVPRGEIRLRVLSPEAASGEAGSAALHLYAELLRDSLNEEAYTAAMAGIRFSVAPHSRGLDITIGGYSDTLDEFVTVVIERIDRLNRGKTHFDEARLLSLRDELLRRMANEVKESPYRQLLRELPATIYEPYWSSRQLMNELAALDTPPLHRFARQWLDGARVNMLVYGNFEEKAARELIAAVGEKIPQPAEESVPPGKVTDLYEVDYIPVRRLSVEHPDHALALYMQGRDDSIEEQALVRLLQQSLATPFYHTLRTRQQLGYIVFTTPYPVKRVPGVVAVVQSPVTPVGELMAATEDFLREYENALLQNFDRDKEAVLTALREKPLNQYEQAGDFWHSITTEDWQFDANERMQAAVTAITREQLVEAYRETIIGGAGKLVLFAGDAQALTAADEGSAGEDRRRQPPLRLVDDMGVFKEKTGGYIYR